MSAIGEKVDLNELIETLSQLAHGRDPQSGAPMPSDAPYHSPRTIRALFAAIDILRGPPATGETPYAAQSSPKRGWNPEQDEELKRLYTEGAALPELMMKLGRSRGALITRLKLLGLIDDADHVRD